MSKQMATINPITQELTQIRFGLPEILARLFDLAFANRAYIQELSREVKALQLANEALKTEVADLRMNHAEGIAEIAKKYMADES